MGYKILLTDRCEKELTRLIRKFPSLKGEFQQLAITLANNPTTGINIGKNCFKIRLSIASKGKGKRGGARVITYLFIEAETVYQLSIYDKSEKADLKSKELREIIEYLELR